MKKEYVTPLLEIEKFYVSSSITTSGEGFEHNPGEEIVDDF